MTKPVEHEYPSHVGYARALEEYCEVLESNLAAMENLLIEVSTSLQEYKQETTETARLFWIEKNRRMQLEARSK